MNDTPISTAAIAQGVIDPQSMSADGEAVTAKSIPELVLAAQFQAAAVAATLPHFGIRRRKVRLPAQVSSHAGPGCGGCSCWNGPGSWY